MCPPEAQIVAGGSHPESAELIDMEDWLDDAACRGHTGVFFAPTGERPEAREVREARARSFCRTCPVIYVCQAWARRHREYGFWGGESEEQRAVAGFRVDLPVGRIARYPRGEGTPVQPRPHQREPTLVGTGRLAELERPVPG